MEYLSRMKPRLLFILALLFFLSGKTQTFFVYKGDTINRSGSHMDDGQSILFNKQGQIFMKGRFVHYKLKDGWQYIYDKDDKLVQIKVFKDFKYVGDAPLCENK